MDKHEDSIESKLNELGTNQKYKATFYNQLR